jgi:hypothetical protein
VGRIRPKLWLSGTARWCGALGMPMDGRRAAAGRAPTRVSPPAGQGEGSRGSPTGSYNGGRKRGWRNRGPSMLACSGGRQRQREAPAAWV